MKALFSRRPTEPAMPAPTADRLAGIPRLAFDEADERPCREDLDYGQTFFTRPLADLPRVFTGAKRSGGRR